MGSVGKPAVLMIGGVTHVQKEWDECSSFATLKEYTGKTRQDFLRDCASGQWDDVVALYRSNESTSITGPFDAELLSQLPPSLKYICHNGAGYDNIDIAAATTHHILVSHTPKAVNAATADMAIFLLLGALRRIHIPYTALREKRWRGTSQLGYDPENKVLGILGMGGIGQQVAKRARAFGMTIQYHNRSRLAPELELGATYVGFEELLGTSDAISLNCSLRKETVGIIGKREFEMMKEGVVLVNTARGKLIDEQALVDALESGKVFSAGLDVYEEEPTINEGLLGNPNVVLLPHIGTATKETQRNMELLVLENMESALKKGVLITQVPEQESKASRL